MIKSCELLRKKHLPCFAHTLNLAVQDNFKKQRVIELIKKCKEIVTFFKSSCIAYEKYKEEQQQIWKGTPNEEKTPYKLLQEVPTRWNSVYYMIQRILLTTDALNNTLLKQRNAPLPLSVDDISTLHDIEKALFIFEDATENISGQKHVTFSLIIPDYGNYNYLSSETMNTEIGKEFCLGLIDSVRKRLFIFETRTIPRITTILDARFKKEGFRNPENANQAADILEQEMATFILQNSKSNEEQNNLHDNHFIRIGPSSSSVIFRFLSKKIKEKSVNVRADAIILKRQYLERPNISGDTDPLLFWKVNGRELEPMQDLVQKYFCIPGSSVESERNFSAAGLIINDRRSRLKSKYVDQLIFLNKNSWLLS